MNPIPNKDYQNTGRKEVLIKRHRTDSDKNVFMSTENDPKRVLVHYLGMFKCNVFLRSALISSSVNGKSIHSLFE